MPAEKLQHKAVPYLRLLPEGRMTCFGHRNVLALGYTLCQQPHQGRWRKQVGFENEPPEIQDTLSQCCGFACRSW